MNIIINGKYASVYAAVHSSVWEGGGEQGNLHTAIYE